MNMKRVEEIVKGIEGLDFSEADIHFLVDTVKQLKRERDNYFKAMCSYGKYIDTLENEYSQAIDVVREHIHEDGRANRIYKVWCYREDQLKDSE